MKGSVPIPNGKMRKERKQCPSGYFTRPPEEDCCSPVSLPFACVPNCCRFREPTHLSQGSLGSPAARLCRQLAMSKILTFILMVVESHGGRCTMGPLRATGLAHPREAGGRCQGGGRHYGATQHAQRLSGASCKGGAARAVLRRLVCRQGRGVCGAPRCRHGGRYHGRHPSGCRRGLAPLPRPPPAPGQ